MKRRIALIILIFSLLATLFGCNTSEITGDTLPKVSEQLTEKEKLEDFEYMYMILKENYPFFDVNKRLNNIDWLSNKNNYIEIVKATKNDVEFFYTLNDILKQLNNGHTNMIDEPMYKYMRSVYMDLGMEPWVNQINNSNALKRYLDQEESSKDSLKNQNQYRRHNNVTTEILQEDKIAYVSIKSFNYYNITEDMKVIKPFLNDVKDFQALIIDIRQNGGGSSTYWSNHLVPLLIKEPLECSWYHAYRGGDFSEVFIKSNLGFGYDDLEPIDNIFKEKLLNSPPELKDSFKYYYKSKANINPKDSIGFNGRIYLLVDRRVYSSSEMFAVFAKSTGFATIIGERTGGDGIGTDPLLCALPNSGYIFKFPGSMGLTNDGTCNEEFKTRPDIEVDAKKRSLLSYDSTIQKVIDIENTK